MAEIITMGEIIVEIMRKNENSPLDTPDLFSGPYPSGAPAIFADTASRLGHKSAIIGGVGDDDFGKCLLNRLKADGVDTSYIKISNTDFTGCAFVSYLSDGSRKFIFHINNTAAVKTEAPCLKNEKSLKFFHIMGCSVTAEEHFGKNILNTAKSAKENGAVISFDPNIRPELLKDNSSAKLINEILNITKIFLPSKDELLMLSGKSEVSEAVKWCFEKPEMKIIAVKNGSKGCRVYTKEQIIEAGVYSISPIDSTGAGDSFDAAFICSLAENSDLINAVKFASAAAALNTMAFGPMEGKISEQSVKEFMKTNEIEVKELWHM